MSWKLQAIAIPMQDIFNSNVVLTALASVHYASRWNGAWVTRPERPKGAKDEVKGARIIQLLVHVGQFPQDGENCLFVSLFF